jgi:formate C-acetyltransferase
VFAERHAELAENMASREQGRRREELLRIAEVCRHVPANPPRDFWEALQMYWFVHLGTITELNGWDAMNPGHLDQHLAPYYQRELERGSLDREAAKELLSCLWIKFNNHPAPPKVGVTAKESGTYNDFTNINLGGLTPEGDDGVSELSYLILEVIDEVRLLQPQSNVQISARTPDRFLKEACRVIRKGYGYPSVFNADAVVAEQVRVGKMVDPRTFTTFDELYEAFDAQLRHFVNVKVEVNQYIESMFARYYPAPFLSVVIRDCIENARAWWTPRCSGMHRRIRISTGTCSSGSRAIATTSWTWERTSRRRSSRGPPRRRGSRPAQRISMTSWSGPETRTTSPPSSTTAARV